MPAHPELQLKRCWRTDRRLMAVVAVTQADAAIYSDTVNLESAAARASFAARAAERLVERNGCGAPELEGALFKLVAEAEQAANGAAAEAEAGCRSDGERASAAELLVQIGARGLLFHDPLGDTYARLSVDAHTEVWPTRSKAFRRWLVGTYYHLFEQVPGSEAVTNALQVLEARAQFDGPCERVHLRLAPDGVDGFYLDLADANWQAVHVTPRGWALVGAPPVHFRRTAGMSPLPVPQSGGHLDELRQFVNVPDPADWPLVKAWLAQAACPTGPYPVLALYGEQGSAKTSLARMLRALIDPAEPDLRSDPRELRDLAIAARATWLVAFDNVSHVQPWLSDALCRLATGGGWATRELYTDFDEALFAAQRPVLLTGITEFVTRGDLLDRALQLVLPPIPDRARRDERRLWAAFEAARPRLLGALLDTAVGALRERCVVQLPRLPRLADFALWAVAAERGRGEAPAFLAAYQGQHVTMHQQALDGSLVGAALQAFLSGEAALGPWSGTAHELLHGVNGQASEATRKLKGWPRTARGMAGELRRLAPALRGLGYGVRFGDRVGREGKRIITLTPPAAAATTEDAEHGAELTDEESLRAAPLEGTAESSAASAPSAPGASPLLAWESAPPTADDPQPPIVSSEPAIVNRRDADDAMSGPGEADAAAADEPTAATDDPHEATVSGSAPESPIPAPCAAAADDADAADGRVATSRLAVSLDSSYTLLADAAAVTDALPTLHAAPMLGLDCETTGLDPVSDRLRLVQLATPERVYLVDCFAYDPRVLAPLLAAGPRLIGHNLKFDLRFLAAAGLPVPAGGRLFDTLLAAQLLGAGSETGYLQHCGLAEVTARTLGIALDKTEQRSDWAGALSAAQLTYAARDAAVLLPLADRLEAELAAADLGRVAALEMRALPALVWLEQSGAPFDTDRWADLSDAAVAEQIRLEAELAAEAGALDLFGVGAVNWSSPAQVLRVLRGRGHTLTHTDEATLQALADREPLARTLLAYREASRKATAYGITFAQDHVHPRTGRIHPDYLQLGAASGRMSCQRPNLQNIPRDPAYRACFRPGAGRVLVKADYSQIELRIAAELTGDTRMLQVYAHGEDLHTVTAAAVLDRAGGAVTRADRQAAKALNFGLLYGMGAARLREHAASHYGVELTPSEAERFRAGFFMTYPGLRAWHRGQSGGTVDTRTLAGRRRLGVTSFTEKLNTPVQGSGADGLKAALALLWETRDRCPTAVPVFCVHDEIVVECDAAEAEAAQVWLVDAMRRGMASFLRRVPVEVEAKIGADWSMQD